MEVGDLRSWLRQAFYFFGKTCDVRFEAFEDFPLCAFDEGRVFVLILTIQNDLGAIGIGVGDPAPLTYGVFVLRVGIDFY